MNAFADPFRPPTVRDIVQRTVAIRGWIDGQIEQGKTDDEIVAMLPFAVEFISGRMTESALLALLMEQRR